MSQFLEEMGARSRLRLEEAKHVLPAVALEEILEMAPAPRSLNGFGEPFDVIAEVKPRSPSEGLFPSRDPVATASAYRDGGAGMLSVLTEPSEFGGSLDQLSLIGAGSSIPVMAKDFLIDPYQVGQARIAGADGVLLIMRMLDDEAIVGMIETAAGMGMFCLVEAFDGADLERIGGLPLPESGILIGVNCRDLATLEVRPERHLELASHLPDGSIAVAESGIETPDDVERVAGAGYRSVLVGSALMRAEEPGDVVRSLLGAGRATRSPA